MSKSNRRLRGDSVSAMVKAAQAAAEGDIRPPQGVSLRPGDECHWIAVVRARARAEWTDADLRFAANLARCFADIERLTDELQSEGDMLANARGTPVANPKHALLEVLSRRAVAIARMLQIQSATNGKARDKLGQREAERKAREVAEGLADEAGEDLLPA